MAWYSIFANFFNKLKTIFTSQNAQTVYDKALELTPKVLPIIDMVATIGVSLTPPKWDDTAWAGIKLAFPGLWDGSLAKMTKQERSLYLLGIASEMIKLRFPNVSTTVARLAAQAVYPEWKAASETESLVSPQDLI